MCCLQDFGRCTLPHAANMIFVVDGIMYVMLCVACARPDMARSFRDDDSGDDEANQDTFYPPPTHSSRAHSSKKCKQCDRLKEVSVTFYMARIRARMEPEWLELEPEWLELEPE